jgi:hypothetical protein
MHDRLPWVGKRSNDARAGLRGRGGATFGSIDPDGSGPRLNASFWD